MKLTKIASLLCLGLLFSQSSIASDADEFVGTWLLVHVQEANELGGWVIADSTVGIYGYINYSANGYMSFQSERPGGPDFTNKGIGDFTNEELRALVMNYGAYFGTYEIDEKAKTVTHNIIGNLIRSRAGTSTSRTYSFNESQLTLTIGESLRYVWRRP
jgi:hypothetical protein